MTTHAHRKRRRITPYEELVARAKADVKAYTPDEAIERLDDDGVVFVDVRDAPELDEGMIRGAIHASRGRLESHIDPASPIYREELEDAEEVVFYCASGARSALAAKLVQELGLDPVATLEGGFAAWTEAGGPTQAADEPESDRSSGEAENGEAESGER